jgi:hypothetical protein
MIMKSMMCVNCTAANVKRIPRSDVAARVVDGDVNGRRKGMVDEADAEKGRGQAG